MDRVISNTALSPTSLVVLCVVIAIAVTWLRSSNSNQPPRLQDKIPYITNTIQYLTDAGRFIDRVKYFLYIIKYRDFDDSANTE